MMTRSFVCALFCVLNLQAQPISVQDNLVLPMNPPKDASPQKNGEVTFSRQFHSDAAQAIIETQQEIASALASGLAEGHPTVKALRAKMSVLLSGPTAVRMAPTSQPEVEILREELRKTKENQGVLEKKIEDMQAALVKLQDELAEVKKDK